MRFARVFAVCFLALACLAAAEDKPSTKAAKKAGASDATYIAHALSAAPPAIRKGAGVVRVESDGSLHTLRDSKNGFTCLIMMRDRMCGDANSMEFFNAMMKKQNPPDKLGITYMLAGDEGASNTDPTAEKKTADNHWIVTGPHIMILGPGAKNMGLPDSPDADPNKPYLMWANTPYAHAMIPVASAPARAMSSMKSEMKGDMGAMKCGKK